MGTGGAGSDLQPLPVFFGFGGVGIAVGPGEADAGVVRDGQGDGRPGLHLVAAPHHRLLLHGGGRPAKMVTPEDGQGVARHDPLFQKSGVVGEPILVGIGRALPTVLLGARFRVRHQELGAHHHFGAPGQLHGPTDLLGFEGRRDGGRLGGGMSLIHPRREQSGPIPSRPAAWTSTGCPHVTVAVGAGGAPVHPAVRGPNLGLRRGSRARGRLEVDLELPVGVVAVGSRGCRRLGLGGDGRGGLGDRGRGRLDLHFRLCGRRNRLGANSERVPGLAAGKGEGDDEQGEGGRAEFQHRIYSFFEICFHTAHEVRIVSSETFVREQHENVSSGEGTPHELEGWLLTRVG